MSSCNKSSSAQFPYLFACLSCLYLLTERQPAQAVLFSAVAAQSEVLSYQKYIQGDGKWEVTEHEGVLHACGDVAVRQLALGKNIRIITPGRVTFEGGTHLTRGSLTIQSQKILLSGDVEISEFAHLQSDELVIEHTLVAHKGALVAAKSVENKGTFRVLGGGLQGHISLFVNNGRVDLSQGKSLITTFRNNAPGVLRTQGHFVLDGDTFHNKGVIFTAGAHHLNLKKAYEDMGHLYAPSLLIVQAPRIEFFAPHQSWLREGAITAGDKGLFIHKNTSFSLSSNKAKCFLQLSSQGSLTYDGVIQQSSASFPFAAYEGVWTLVPKSWARTSSMAPHPLECQLVSIAPWESLRNPLESGVVFHTEGDALDLSGKVTLMAGSVRKLVKNTLTADGLTLKAGHFTEDRVDVHAKNAFLKRSDLAAVKTQVTLHVQEKAHLHGYNVDGRFLVEGDDVHFSAPGRSQHLAAIATGILSNETRLETTEDLFLKAPHLRQMDSVSAGGSLVQEATKQYEDAACSVNEAGKSSTLRAEKTKETKGTFRSSYHTDYLATATQAGFEGELARRKVENAIFHLPDLDFHSQHDLSITPNVWLYVHRFNNHHHLQTQGDFRVYSQTSVMNTGFVDILGQGYFGAPDWITNRDRMRGGKGLGLNTRGILVHKGYLSGADGRLDLYAHHIDATAEGLKKRSIFEGSAIYAEAEIDFLADGAQARAQEAAFIAGEQLRLGAYKETLSSTDIERSWCGDVRTIRTWEEACVFDASCSKSLILHSHRGHVKGEGAALDAPFIKVYGEKGVNLNELRLTKTERVERRRACFEILGVDICSPFEDGFTPKLSIEAGSKKQTTLTHYQYGQLGTIIAQHFEVGTGKSGYADLRGSHLSTDKFVTDTPLLHLGGCQSTMTVEDHKTKVTAGVAWAGGPVPTASFSTSNTQNGQRSFQVASVRIGSLENLFQGMQLHASQGITGGIKSSQGEKWNATINHAQTVSWRRGSSLGFSMTGNTGSLSMGHEWGEQKTSRGTDFSIQSAPNLTLRQDIRLPDENNFSGFGLDMGFSSSGVTSIGGSLQIKGQTFSGSSNMFGSVNASEVSLSASERLNHTISQAKCISTLASNFASLGALGGADVKELQQTLSQMNAGLGVVTSVSSAAQNFAQFWTQVLESSDTAFPQWTRHPQRAPQGTRVPASAVPPTRYTPIDDAPKGVQIPSPEHKQEPLTEVSAEDIFQMNRLLVITNAADFSEIPKNWHHRSEDSYTFISQEKFNEIIQTGELGVQYLSSPQGFVSLLSGSPHNFISTFQNEEPGMVRLYSIASKRDWEQQIFEIGGDITKTAVQGCINSVATSFILEGPLALPTAPEICVLGAGRSLWKEGLSWAAGQTAYEMSHRFNTSEETARISQEVSQGVISSSVDSFLNPPVVHVQSPQHDRERRSVLIDGDRFDGYDSFLQSTGQPGVVHYRHAEIRSFRDLTHMSDADIIRMARNGVAPYDIHGSPLQLHHLNQQDHRGADAILVMIPKQYHRLSNSRQHPHGNEIGIGTEARKDFNNFRRSLYRAVGRDELDRREHLK